MKFNTKYCVAVRGGEYPAKNENVIDFFCFLIEKDDGFMSFYCSLYNGFAVTKPCQIIFRLVTNIQSQTATVTSRTSFDITRGRTSIRQMHKNDLITTDLKSPLVGPQRLRTILDWARSQESEK